MSVHSTQNVWWKYRQKKSSTTKRSTKFTLNSVRINEYTISELREIGKGLGYREEKCVTAFYFDARFARHGPEGVKRQPIIGTLKNSLVPTLP